MGNLNRIALLKEFADEEPHNPFNWYALAIEYREVDPDKALPLFEKLLQKHPEYLPTYFIAAQFFAEMEELDVSKDIYVKGISLARNQGEQKALQELQNAYQNFLFENDMD